LNVKATKKRYNDWGHSLRDLGIKESSGDYIIHFNPDNILYENALEVLNKHEEDILVFSIKMIGMEEKQVHGRRVRYYKPIRDVSKFTVLSGNPITYGNIDCMQFIMKRDLWCKHGGWYDKRETSDGFIYPEVAKDKNIKYITDILGEHY